MSSELVIVENIKKYFPVRKSPGCASQYLRAVDDVSFSVMEGETLGLVGESGCGKSTTGRIMLNLLKPTSGSIHFCGRNIFDLNPEQMRSTRRQMQIVFQDPYASLNPRMKVADIVGEPFLCHEPQLSKKDRYDKVNSLLEKVGLDASYSGRYPHEFSGGQRQRIGIARAVCLNPKFIICDEAVSALDVSVQAQILNLLKDLQAEYGLTYVFIAHNLSVVKYISDRICVMYLGKIVEICPKEEIFDNPLHPYTKALLSAIPIPDPDISSRRILLEGDIPSPVNPPKGCRFSSRCQQRTQICQEAEPMLRDMGGGHQVACHQI